MIHGTVFELDVYQKMCLKESWKYLICMQESCVILNLVSYHVLAWVVGCSYE